MTQYDALAWLDPDTGNTLTVAASELTQRLQVNRILLQDGKHVGIITHRDLVSFCRWCFEKTLAQRQTVPPEVYVALALVDKWLIDPGSVSSEELSAAGEAAWDVATDAETARVAWATAVATDAETHDAAGSAAWAANSAGVPFEAQTQWLVEHLRSAQ